MSLEYLKEAINDIKNKYVHFKEFREDDVSFSNLDHIVNTGLNLLQDQVGLLADGIEVFEANELIEIVSDVNNYFSLLDSHTDFKAKEINGPGFFPESNDFQAYIKHAVKHFKV